MDFVTFTLPDSRCPPGPRCRPGKISAVSLPLSPHAGHPALRKPPNSLTHGTWPHGSLVASLTEGDRAALLAAGTHVHFDDDAILVLQGDVGDGLYVLTGGMVKVIVAAETGIETTLAVRSRGDLIGEFAVLDGTAARPPPARSGRSAPSGSAGRASLPSASDARRPWRRSRGR